MNKDLNLSLPAGTIRGISLALACLATSLLFTSVTVVFTAGANAAPAVQFAAAAAPTAANVG